MTTKNHTPIATGAAANASTFNTPLGSLDAAIGDLSALTTTAKTSAVASINELDAGKLESGASAALIANTPAGNVAATNVQAAIDELDTEKQPLDADLTAIAAISPTNDDVIQRKSGAWTNRTMAELKADLALTAENITNVAAGTIVATNVQDAIDELDTEKAAASHTHTVSAVTDQGNWKLDNFGTADDNTDLNATTTQHGLLAKLSGVAGYFMDGLGAWARAFVSIMWSGSGNFQAKYINFKGSAVTGVSYNATLDSVDVTITGGTGTGATLLTDLTDVAIASPPDDSDVLSYDTASSKWINVAAGAGHTIQDEGVNLTNRNTLNFVGAGVTVADVNLKTTVMIDATTQNLLINGGFDYWQRGGVATASTMSDDAYNAPDRWYSMIQGANSTIQMLDGGYKSKYACKIVAGGTTYRHGIAQIVESTNSIPMRGKSIIAQAMIDAIMYAGSGSIDMRMAILEWTGTADTVTSELVADWTSGTYTTAGFFASTTLTVVGTAKISAAHNIWTQLSVTGTVSTSCNNLIVFIWTEDVPTHASDYVLVSEAGLYQSSSIQAWNPRHIGEELTLCQRYYEKTTALGTSPLTNSNGNGIYYALYFAAAVADTGNLLYVPFSVSKFSSIAVTVRPYTTAANTSRVSNIAGVDLAAGSGTPMSVNTHGFAVRNSSGGSITPTTGGFAFHWQGEAEL